MLSHISITLATSLRRPDRILLIALLAQGIYRVLAMPRTFCLPPPMAMSRSWTRGRVCRCSRGRPRIGPGSFGVCCGHGPWSHGLGDCVDWHRYGFGVWYVSVAVTASGVRVRFDLSRPAGIACVSFWWPTFFDATLGFPGEGPRHQVLPPHDRPKVNLAKRRMSFEASEKISMLLGLFADWLRDFFVVSLYDLLKEDGKIVAKHLALYGQLCTNRRRSRFIRRHNPRCAPFERC